MALELAPIDSTVRIPESVKRAAAAADAIHQAAYKTSVPQPPQPPALQLTNPPVPQDGDSPINIVAAPSTDVPVQAQVPVPPPVVAPEVPVQVQPQPVSPPVENSPQPETNWEHRYYSMDGRYRQATQTIGGLQEQVRQLDAEVRRLQSGLQRTLPAPNQGTPKLVTPKDVETYGNELIDFAKRAAREAVAPQLAQVHQENEELKRARAADAVRNVHSHLDGVVPDWRSLNENPQFLDWLRLPDVYSGKLRIQLMREAFQAADAPRVSAFFSDYVKEAQATGQLPAPQPQAGVQPPRIAARPLSTLVSPGSATPSPVSTGVSASKPTITRSQIREFYSNEGRKRYAGREADRIADQQIIFEAQSEGRVI